MVKLHVKKGDESQFLFETNVQTLVDDVLSEITIIYNGRLKVGRVCMEIEELSKHGTMLPPNMMGLTDEQVEELKLVDEWGDKCVPSGGWSYNKDEIGRRNGRQPNEKMQEVLQKTIEEAKAIISKKQVQSDVPVTKNMVQEALDMLRGAVTIVYPMGLPPHDTISQEFENCEDLSGTQASLEVIEISLATLWFSGKEMQRGKKLSDFVGKNEKTRAVVKLQKMGQGAPGREPVMSEAEQKAWMMHAYRKQEEMKVGTSTASHSEQVVSAPAEPVGAPDTVFRIEEKPKPVLDVSAQDNEDVEDSSEVISRMLSSSGPDRLADIIPVVGEAPLTNITCVINSNDYSIFNIYR